MARMQTSLQKLALQISLSDLDVQHGHARGFVTEQVHDPNQADTAMEHIGGVGMSELMRDGAKGCRDGFGIGAQFATKIRQ